MSLWIYSMVCQWLPRPVQNRELVLTRPESRNEAKGIGKERDRGNEVGGI